MKRIKFFLLVSSFMFVFICSNASFGQLGLRKGIMIGHNWAKLTGKGMENVESRKATAVGVGLEFSLVGLWSLEADALYSPKGVIFQNGNEIKLQYLSIPIVLKKKFFPVGIHPYILGGTELNFLIKGERNYTDKNAPSFQSQNMAIVAGGGIELSFLGKGAYLEGRYSYGTDNVYTDTQLSAKNRVLQVFIGLLF